MTDFRRVSSTFAVVTGTRLQTITGVEKVIAVTVLDSNNRDPLAQLLYEEMLYRVPTTGVPTAWAVKRVGASSSTLLFDSSFASATNLTIVGEEVASTLSGAQVPAFSESFHDILVYGALADELRKMQKLTLARDSELDYERILSELRHHLAVSAFTDIVQGKESKHWCASCQHWCAGNGVVS
jgi:hypothetical protein